MIQYFSKKLRNKKGFTLVELLLVIAILGIIAGVAVPRVLNANTSTTFKADKATANMIVSKLEAMVLLEEVHTASTNWVAITEGNTTDGLDYQENVPTCQSSGADFVVQIKVNTNGSYDIHVGTVALTAATAPGALITTYSSTATTNQVWAIGVAQPVAAQ